METKKLVAKLEKTGRKGRNALWLDIAARLSKPRRKRVSVNLWKINALSGIFENKILLVPGKVLGTGQIENKVRVAALEFSLNAETKIKKAGGELFTIDKLLKKAPKPSGIVIVK